VDTPPSLAARVRGRFPALFLLARRGYHLVSALAGTRVQEIRWARRGAAEVSRGFSNLDHPHRQFILEHITRLGPWASLLEVGSGYGPNLYHLARRFPDAVLQGLDINPVSVSMGTAWLRKVGLPQVDLSVGRGDDLRKFANGEFDLVLTNAFLMYIGPDRIERTVGEMLRVARRHLILVEHQWNEDDSHGAGRFQSGRWMRDYEALLRRCAPGWRVDVTKVPAALWSDEAWQRFGCIITCRLAIEGGEDAHAHAGHRPR